MTSVVLTVRSLRSGHPRLVGRRQRADLALQAKASRARTWAVVRRPGRPRVTVIDPRPSSWTARLSATVSAASGDPDLLEEVHAFARARASGMYDCD